MNKFNFKCALLDQKILTFNLIVILPLVNPLTGFCGGGSDDADSGGICFDSCVGIGNAKECSS